MPTLCEGTFIDWATIANFVVAAGTLALAGVTWRIVEATKKAALGQLLHTLLSEWSSDIMTRAIVEVRSWIDSNNKTRASLAAQPGLDGYRRVVTTYFQKVHALRCCKLITDKIARTAATRGQAELYLALEPLDVMMAEKKRVPHDNASFAYLSKLHGIPRSRPLPDAHAHPPEKS